jgi:hypothetical protein
VSASGIQRLADLREPPTVGTFYLVPVIEAFPYYGRVDTWPVIGPKHRDADFFSFKDEHYHVDARFLTAAQERFLTKGDVWGYPTEIEDVVGRGPLADRDRSLPKGRPALRRRKCRRATYGHVYGHTREVQALRDHYREPAAPLRLADGRLLCPHRKADLSNFPPDADGLVTCPLHGLRVCIGKSHLPESPAQ